MLKKIPICYKNYNFFDNLFNKLFFNTTFIQVLFLNMHLIFALNFVLLLYFVFNFSFIKMFTSPTPKHKIPWFISNEHWAIDYKDNATIESSWVFSDADKRKFRPMVLDPVALTDPNIDLN